MRALLYAIVGASVASCTSTSVVPLAADTIEITTSAAPVCGATGAQSVAFHRAAVETIKAGFDRFVILGQQATNNVGVVGYTALTAHTYGTASAYGGPGYANVTGSATTTYSGGQPIIAGHHDDALVVKMFHEGDPAGADAVSARGYLGPGWQSALSASSVGTCF